MTVKRAYLGEDVPIQIEYTDDTGSAVDPDDTAVDPEITITDPDDTDVVDATVMDSLEVGEFEYVWDTATDAGGEGRYTIEISADFSSETEITRESISIR